MKTRNRRHLRRFMTATGVIAILGLFGACFYPAMSSPSNQAMSFSKDFVIPNTITMTTLSDCVVDGKDLCQPTKMISPKTESIASTDSLIDSKFAGQHHVPLLMPGHSNNLITLFGF